MRLRSIPALVIALAASPAAGAAQVELRAFGGDGIEVSLARAHASIERTPPARLPADPYQPDLDPDALRFVVVGAADDLPATLSFASVDERGAGLDALRDVPLAHVPCPSGVPSGMVCGSTLPIRAVADEIDRYHPLIKDRSIRAALGGAIAVVSAGGEVKRQIRVAGPRASPVGAIERYRATLRVRLVRHTPGGAPPIGKDDRSAIDLAKAEIERAASIWGQCGVGFGPEASFDVTVVDPPKAPMLVIGCDHGLPASGGAIRARIDGKDIEVKIPLHASPRAAAQRVGKALRAAGFSPILSDNPIILAGGLGSVDVLVRRRNGAPAAVEPPASGPMSTDETLGACLGRVDLSDGLTHFTDSDSIAGTVEERALIKAFDDPPGVVRVFWVPAFAGGGRLGESFIAADGGAIRNVLIQDRASLRVDKSSFTLAHELGHILLDDPGHPDDLGQDTPTRLMDADAANPTAFGPRRLTLIECARAVRQSAGGGAPLLKAWPLSPIKAP